MSTTHKSVLIGVTTIVVALAFVVAALAVHTGFIALVLLVFFVGTYIYRGIRCSRCGREVIEGALQTSPPKKCPHCGEDLRMR